jgi:protein-S-isoprenylcysteine O-methyltransferase Ste14
MERLNFLGIGPKIGIVFLPWLAITIVFSQLYSGYFIISNEYGNLLLIAGIILLLTGLTLYFSTVRLLLKGLKETRLVTAGAYGLCQNPLYSSIILLIVPALALLLNTWLILTASVAGYITFKIFISSEYKELEKFFGEEYLKYKQSTPEFFPRLRKSGLHSYSRAK